jgi:hypothetical protein
MSLVLEQTEAAGAERVSRGETGPDPLGSHEVGGLHAQRVEHVLEQVAVEGLPAHLLDDLSRGVGQQVAHGDRREAGPRGDDPAAEGLDHLGDQRPPVDPVVTTLPPLDLGAIPRGR